MEKLVNLDLSKLWGYRGNDLVGSSLDLGSRGHLGEIILLLQGGELGHTPAAGQLLLSIDVIHESDKRSHGHAIFDRGGRYVPSSFARVGMRERFITLSTMYIVTFSVNRDTFWEPIKRISFIKIVPNITSESQA